MNLNIKTPVVLIAFNRPETTKKAFEAIRSVQPKKLFVAIDGARDHKPDEAALCKEVLEITKNIDWDCEAQYLVREKNLGCKYGVTGGISWALENEESVIVIEDDIVPVPSFFSFAEELLEKYKNEDNIVMISGNNYTPLDSVKDDYTFSQYGHIWGWATWKNKWEKFNVEVPEIYNAVETHFDKMQFITKQERNFFSKYFTKLASRMKAKTENAWGPQFMFYRFNNNLLSIVPNVNLASNIGENSSRAEDNHSKPMEHYYASDSNFRLKKHPENIAWNKEYDAYHFKNHIDKLSLSGKIIYKLKKKLNIK